MQHCVNPGKNDTPLVVFLVPYIIYLSITIFLIYQSLTSESEDFWILIGLLIGTSVLVLILYIYKPRKKK